MNFDFHQQPRIGLPAREPAVVGRGVLTPPGANRMPLVLDGALRTARPTNAGSPKLRKPGTVSSPPPLLECGDSSPLWRGDWSPSNGGSRPCAMGHSQLAPAVAHTPSQRSPDTRRRPVACAKAVTSHRTPPGARCVRRFNVKISQRVRLPRPVRHERGEGWGEGCSTPANHVTLAARLLSSVPNGGEGDRSLGADRTNLRND